MAANNGNDNKSQPKNQLILNAFVEMCSGHQSPGGWQHPQDQSHRFNDVHYWCDLAKKLEAGKFHGIFIGRLLYSLNILQTKVLLKRINSKKTSSYEEIRSFKTIS